MAYPASWNQEVDECAKIVNGNALWSWIYAVDDIFVEESDKNNSLIMIYVGKEEKMQKTKLGISVGTLCAAIYFTGIFGGYFTAVFLAGYVLLVENNEWLRKNAVKAIVLMIIFSIVTAIINLIPDAMSCVEHIMSAMGLVFSENCLSNLIAAITSVIDICQKLLFIILGTKALNQGTIHIPSVDRFINKYVN